MKVLVDFKIHANRSKFVRDDYSFYCLPFHKKIISEISTLWGFLLLRQRNKYQKTHKKIHCEGFFLRTRNNIEDVFETIMHEYYRGNFNP